ncbi:PSD1 and planctomycete cytochrome C domain-containing protein [Gimesia sp.]|mgnify:CR=1 FL=1|uniref:PSD1 and planctomycete cytochrome C domain-containing protein n=1 Tax=Gimesia sp. TaxID=2024833 RepID=UPI0025BFF9E3|nr:PSD1 and planctomycete cytochrome C domain-containing protein [Gimesia sp.]
MFGRLFIFIGLLSTINLELMADERDNSPTSFQADSADNVDATQQSDSGIDFFESQIRPVLVKHCYDCHSTESGTAEGGLRVDDRLAIRAGGGRGPAIVPGKPKASLLLSAISHADVDLKMPPKEAKFSANVIRDFEKWIEMGAPDPRDGDVASIPGDWSGMQAAKTHWAYQKPSPSAPPQLEDDTWSLSKIDRFVLAGLREHQLKPADDAKPKILLRRLHFDLVGFPPSPEAVKQFVEACETEGVHQALSSEVDRLLASPRFGERWGRHWLDVARFGESSGKEANIPFPHAWRYRDYVIDSVNADVPIDQFFTEQLAGDLLPYESKQERARLLIATGYLAIGTKNLSESNQKQFQADIYDEQIDSMSRGILASSVACARCHDHKYDPFAMQDYYSLVGIFGSTKTYFGTFVSPASQQGGELMPLPRLPDEVILHDGVPEKKVAEMEKQLAGLRAEAAEMKETQVALFSGKKPKKVFTLRDVLANIWKTGPLVGKLQTIDEQGKPIPIAMGVLDSQKMFESPIYSRGDINHPGETVPRAFPRAIAVSDSISVPSDESGRRELAIWLTHPDHPLTSRVFVNRVWQHLFGVGLVSTVDNFGTTGAAPSHPELLDTLALQFIEEGWSLKTLVRKLVLSRTYRQDSSFRETAFRVDPENRFLWRMPKRRLEAEAIRDAMLAVSGELDLTRPEGSLVANVIGDRPISLIGLDKRLPPDLDGTLHRSVYLPVIRDRLPDVLELFDFAEPSLVTGDREQTNVPVQALYLMNSPFVLERARSLAMRLMNEADSDQDRLRLAYRLCFSRDPDTFEEQYGMKFLAEVTETNDKLQSEASLGLISFCQSLLSTAEFRNLD